MNRDGTKVAARHFMQTNSAVDDIVFVPIKAVRKKNLWAKLEVDRKFINDDNLLEDGLKVNCNLHIALVDRSCSFFCI